VSVDPERDGLEHLKQYVTYFDARFVGATGSHAALQELARQVGVLYARAPGGDASGYLVDHSASILLTDPQGRLAALFSPPHDAAALAKDVASLAGIPRP
jgi:protein SCO1/2